MKLGDKFIKNQDEYIKELKALLRQKEEENAALKKDITNKEIEYKSQISELTKSKKELLSSNNKLRTENDKANKQIKKSDKLIAKLEKEKEKAQGELKLAHAQLEIIINHLVNAQLMTRKAIEELYGPSSEKSSKLFKNNKSEDKNVNVEKEKTTHSPGRDKGTQNLGNWVVSCYDEIMDNSELPLECADPKHPNEVGKLIKERTVQKIVVPKARLQMVYKKVGIYQRRDGTTFEVIFDDKDPFGFSACTPSLASYLTYLKCALYLPNDRIEHMFEVQGTPISKQLQLNYLVKTSEFFKIAFERMHADLLTKEVLHADETTFNNLGAKENKTNYVWSLSTARVEPNQAVCYFYKDNRKYENADQILQNFKGVIVSDRYQAYEIEGTENAFCWSHARRKYTDIIKHLNEGTEEYETIKSLIEKINKIFYLESSYTSLKITGDNLVKKRQDEVKPIVNEYFEKIKSLVTDSHSEINIAFNYSINGEAGLRLFLENSLIDPSNNIAENMMRKVAKIRDNSLFSATTKGANATMILLSIVQTCIINLVNPEKYIKYYLENYKNINEANVDNYLPYSKSLPKELYFSKKDIEQMKEATAK